MRTLRRPRLAHLASVLVTLGCLHPEVAAAPPVFGFSNVGSPFTDSELDGIDVADAGSCAECHRAIADEWRDSMHAHSYVDPVFQAEFRGSADPATCVACHAPFATAERGGHARRELGITCAACHVREGAILGTRAAPAAAPHAVRVVPELHDSSFCGGCHDFRFSVVLGSGEHVRGAGVECHMPRVDRAGGSVGHSHRMADLRDLPFVRSSLDVAATKRREGAWWVVQLTLTVRDAGHRVPTGDVFRALRVRVSNRQGTQTRVLRRHLVARRQGRALAWAEERDTRVQPGEPRVVEVRLRDDGTPIHYAIDILRASERANDARAQRRGFPPGRSGRERRRPVSCVAG